MNYVVYHRSDLDGRTSAAVIANLDQSIVELVPYDYSDPSVVTNLYESLTDEDEVVIVDITIGDEIKEVVNSCLEKTTVIDHHPRTIINIPENTKGLRDDRFSAAALTYMYYHKCVYNDLPLGVQMVSLWDTHADSSRMWRDVLKFYLFAQTEIFGVSQFDPGCDFFQGILSGSISYVKHCIDEGALLEPYIATQAKLVHERALVASVNSDFEGEPQDYVALVLFGLDYSLVGNYMNDSFLESFDFIFTINGSSDSCYVKVNSHKMQARMYAETLGGGGHDKCGGFQCNGFKIKADGAVTHLEFLQ